MKKTKYKTVQKNTLLSQYTKDTEGTTCFEPAQDFAEQLSKKDAKQK